MKERRTYRVYGGVQGVGFRWWARETATGLGLDGTVRNEPDGTVRLDVAGETDELDRFQVMLARGPAAAHVTAVREEQGDASDLPDGFRIVH